MNTPVVVVVFFYCMLLLLLLLLWRSSDDQSNRTSIAIITPVAIPAIDFSMSLTSTMEVREMFVRTLVIWSKFFALCSSVGGFLVRSFCACCIVMCEQANYADAANLLVFVCACVCSQALHMKKSFDCPHESGR